MNAEKKERILIVEDEALVARELKSRLIQMGWEVAGIAYGEEAVELARETSFRGMVGDIHVKDWEAWHYDVGFVVYTLEHPGELPCQIMQYWTDPSGYAYP